jgi:hypothetical protein
MKKLLAGLFLAGSLMVAAPARADYWIVVMYSSGACVDFAASIGDFHIWLN